MAQNALTVRVLRRHFITLFILVVLFFIDLLAVPDHLSQRIRRTAGYKSRRFASAIFGCVTS